MANRSTEADGAAPVTPRPRVLVFAYSCSPGRGSEPGVGWGVVRGVAKFADCTVLVGPEHSRRLADWGKQHGTASLTFVEVPEPALAPWAKWHRVLRFLVYLFWLRRAYRAGHVLHERRPFDFVHHVTYSTYWLPAPLRRFDVPTVWGPVGGAVTTPFRLWTNLGLRGILTELVDLVCVRLTAMLPATRDTWRAVTTCVVQNDETLRQLPKQTREKATLLNHVLFTDVPAQPAPRQRQSHVLYLSHLESRKGPRLAIRALANTPSDVQLVVAGDGPERGALERLARRLQVEDRVRFLGSVSRERALELLAEAAAVVFTGLREEGGVALAEAMLIGAPIIVLANGGARTVAQAAHDPERVTLVDPAGPAETARRLGVAMTAFVRNPRDATGPNIDQAQACRRLQQVFDRTADAFVSETRRARRGRWAARSPESPRPGIIDAQPESQ